MPSLKISQLNAGGALQGTDLIPIARSGANFSIMGSALGGVTGSGTAGVVPQFTSATTIANSTMTTTVQATLTSVATATQIGAQWVLSPQALTFSPAATGGHGDTTISMSAVTGQVGQSLNIRGGTTNSTNIAGNVHVNGGANAAHTGAFLDMNGGSSTGGDATISGGSSTAGRGGQVNLVAGSSSNARGGDIELFPGLGSSAANNGVVWIGQNSAANDPRYFYLANVTFANLAAPSTGPASLNTHGALIFGTDVKGPQDGATFGSVAAGSGTGAMLKYTGSAWVVIG